MALNGAKNAGILAAQIIGAFDPAVGQRVADYKKRLEGEALSKVTALREEGWPNGFDV
jgi:5-(carboxyamino)imidazole ribonucleotide mutase